MLVPEWWGGQKALLIDIADAIDQNLSSLETWSSRGSTELEMDGLGSDGARSLDRTGNFEFVYSAANDRYRANWIPSSNLVQSGVPSVLSEYSELKTASTFFRFDVGGRSPEGKEIGFLFVEPLERFSKNKSDRSIVPTDQFSLNRFDVSRHLRFLASLGDHKFDGYLGVVRTNGEIVLSVNGPRVEEKYVFSERHNFSLVKISRRALDGSIDENWKVTLQEIDGVFVPEFVTHQILREGGRYRRDLRFAENRVNLPIPEIEFTPEKMGVKVGTPVVDTVLGLKYEYGNKGGWFDLSREHLELIEGPDAGFVADANPVPEKIGSALAMTESLIRSNETYVSDKRGDLRNVNFYSIAILVGLITVSCIFWVAFRYSRGVKS